MSSSRIAITSIVAVGTVLNVAAFIGVWLLGRSIETMHSAAELFIPFVWSVTPYAAFVLTSLRMRSIAGIVTLGALLIGFDLLIKLDCILYPTSTAPLAVFFAPFCMLFALAVVGAAQL